MTVAIVGNYLPRRCGIATFTTNLMSSILANIEEKSINDSFVVAVNDSEHEHNYPDIVKNVIRQNVHADYTTAANFINNSKADICIIQHEFGIYGGESGLFILALLNELKIPVITTLHTVLKTPSYHERHIIKKIGELSQKVIVMSDLAVKFLSTIYRLPVQKITHIQHGVPDFTNNKKHNKRFNYVGKKTLGTFGFLGRSKGIETVINALPKVVKEHPEVVYVVLGQTHPNVKKHSGEEYRNYLKNLAKNNNVADNVIFEDQFFEEKDLVDFLEELDIYITPYINEAQITSGTISYAIGAGSCTVSTPFWHAKELLSNGRGRLFGFRDSDDLASILCDLLNNPIEIQEIKKAAFEYGKNMYWSKIGMLYKNLLKKVVENSLDVKSRNKYISISSLPKFSMDHIKRLTDNMGILEHANYSIPNNEEGYCLDDNSRALLLVLMAYDLGLDRSSIRLSDTYLQYIKLMQKEDGYFHNDLSYDRTFLDKVGSDDSFGRTIWAIGYLIRLAPNDSHFQFAKDVFFKSLPNFKKIKSIRAIANIIIGITHFLKRYPDDERIIQILNFLASKLLLQYKDESDDKWKWFEPILCYENAIIPLALWCTYSITKDKETLMVANESTSFLDEKLCKNNKISLVGNKWYYKGEEMPIQGQQPINAMAMVMMYSKAFEVTKREIYNEKMFISFSWFLGNNDLQIPLVDEESNGCCDGLELSSVNRNQGAESTISYLLAYLTVYDMQLKMQSSQNPLTNNNFNLIDVIQINKKQMKVI